MITKKLLYTVFVSAVFLVNIPGVCLAQSADNTGINKRDRQAQDQWQDQHGQDQQTRDQQRDPKRMTADQQGQSKGDREITQKIRQAVLDEESLSSYANNIKIITVNGMVTLKGPVRSEEEKNMIEEKAAAIVGHANIKSEIDIAPPKKTNE